MGYMHIDNLYKDPSIITMFREVYALEKIHGTSAHISYKADYEPRDTPSNFKYFAGEFDHRTFVKLFDEQKMLKSIEKDGTPSFTIYGEYYGGKIQGMKHVYGILPKFVAFDVKIDDQWLDVPRAADFCNKLDIEFVFYERIPADIESVNKARDRASEQAKRNGMGEDKIGEGIVLRPLTELTLKNGKRVIAKHKRDEFRETLHERKVEVDVGKVERVRNANMIAEEWVTEMRLTHVLDKIHAERCADLAATDYREIEAWERAERFSMSDTREVIDAMVEDVLREAEGEIEDSKEARNAICKRTAELFKTRIRRLDV